MNVQILEQVPVEWDNQWLNGIINIQTKSGVLIQWNGSDGMKYHRFGASMQTQTLRYEESQEVITGWLIRFLGVLHLIKTCFASLFWKVKRECGSYNFFTPSVPFHSIPFH